MEPSVKGGLKICSNGHGPLIKMAATFDPFYGKIKFESPYILYGENVEKLFFSKCILS